MAKEQWKKVGVVVGIISLFITLVVTVTTVAYTSGGGVAEVKGDIESVKGNAVEDRAAIDKLEVRTTKLEVEANESKLRDARIAGQYTNIESYMKSDLDRTKEIASDIKEYRKEHEAQVESNRKEQQSRTEAIIRIQAQIDNLERVD